MSVVGKKNQSRYIRGALNAAVGVWVWVGLAVLPGPECCHHVEAAHALPMQAETHCFQTIKDNEEGCPTYGSRGGAGSIWT